MEGIIQDLRYAVRMLRRSPVFAAVAVISIAIGIGANTAIFTLLDAVLLRALPVAEPERLAFIQSDRGESINADFSYPNYVTVRDGSEVFDGLAAVSPISLAVAENAAAQQVEGEAVSGNYFSVLGVPAARGRFFTATEDREGAGEPVVVLSHRLWMREFGGDVGALGRTVRLAGHPFTMIGVAPDRFHGLRRGIHADFWIPLSQYRTVTGDDFFARPQVSWLVLVGRLRPGLTRESADAALAPFTDTFRAEGRFGESERVILADASKGQTGDVSDIATPLKILMGAVAILLLIACANVANLLLARSSGRSREIAVRLSVGATRGRLARQLLTESMLLALIGASAGVFVAVWGVDALSRFRPPTGASIAVDARVDARVLAFTASVAIVTGLLFGLAPALQLRRWDLANTLRGGPARSPGRFGTRGLIVAAQVALSLVLLFGAGLLGRSLRNLASVELGFATRDALVADIDLTSRQYTPQAGGQFYRELLRRLRATPGVEYATAATTVWPHPYGSSVGDILQLEGYTPASPNELVEYDLNRVGPDYFETTETPIVLGRSFEPRDFESGAARVVVINETMARRYWPEQSPVGRLIREPVNPGSPPNPPIEIIGVAADGKYRSLREEPTFVVYTPLVNLRAFAKLIVRTRGEPVAFASDLRRVIAELDPGVPVYDVRTMREHVGLALSQDRMAALLTSSFGALALLLATIGLYGVVSYFVAQRTREIGVRMALGARRSDVLGMVVRRALGLVSLGLLVGLAGAFAVARALESVLFGLSATDPLTFVVATLVLTAVAILASYLPAQRAARVDPVRALRTD
jgi:predicted permease